MPYTRKDDGVDERIVKVARANPELSMMALQERFKGQAGQNRIREMLKAAGITPPQYDGLSTILYARKKRVRQGVK